MVQVVRTRHGAAVLRLMLGLAVIGPGALGAAAPAQAQGGRDEPLMAVIALGSQRVTIYSARGRIAEAPVSTGKSGHETPAGIYSVLEKNRDHYSNLYDDAAMPFMQRLTWSGIALHSGALPGYPASHGCIRMPHEFAGSLFDGSKTGMRVVVVRDDMSPVEVSHPALFKPQPGRQTLAALKVQAAAEAAKKAQDLRRVANRASREAEDFEDRLVDAKGSKRLAQARIEEAEHLGKREGASVAEKFAAFVAKARDRLASAEAEIEAIYAQGKAKIDAAVTARADAKSALAASVEAEKEAKATETQPVSVFISRKTQRLYVRKAFEPLFESEVTIADPNAPIGTTLFTVLGYSGDDSGLIWSALAMYPNGGGRNAGSGKTSAEAAKAALDRIAIPKDALERINEMISPASSLIVSDEASSKETSKGTDFIVLMSGEPQGGIKRRPRTSSVARGYDYSPYPPSGAGFFSWR